METEKNIKLKEALGEKIPAPIIEYIIWQLGNMPGSEALAEKTADELIGGKIKPGDIWDKVVERAEEEKSDNCAMLSDAEVYRIVRKALFIDSVVTDAMAAGFVPSGIPAPISVPGSSAKVSIDLDGLFD